MTTTIKTRNDTGANWTAANPVLAQGEQGYDRTAGKIKVGDGVSTWSALSYASGDAETFENWLDAAPTPVERTFWRSPSQDLYIGELNASNEAVWVKVSKGSQGDPGADGVDGTDGENGENGTEIWSGTYADWFALSEPRPDPAIWTDASPNPDPLDDDTSTAYSIVAADMDRTDVFTAATKTTITINLDATTSLLPGHRTRIIAGGAEGAALAVAVGVTLVGFAGGDIAQGDAVDIENISTDLWAAVYLGGTTEGAPATVTLAPTYAEEGTGSASTITIPTGAVGTKQIVAISLHASGTITTPDADLALVAQPDGGNIVVGAGLGSTDTRLYVYYDDDVAAEGDYSFTLDAARQFVWQRWTIVGSDTTIDTTNHEEDYGAADRTTFDIPAQSTGVVAGDWSMGFVSFIKSSATTTADDPTGYDGAWSTPEVTKLTSGTRQPGLAVVAQQIDSATTADTLTQGSTQQAHALAILIHDGTA